MPISQFGKKARLRSIDIIDKNLNHYKIDLKELGNDSINLSRGRDIGYRDLRPHSCDCAGILSPEEEMEWHVNHIGTCLKTLKEIDDFQNQMTQFIIKKSEYFNQKKEQVWKNISQKAQEIDYKSKFGSDYNEKSQVINCFNSQQLKLEEEKHLVHLENLTNTWQKNSEAEKEKVKKQEEERIKQEQQKTQAEEAERKKREEEIEQKEQEFKNQVEEERNETNPKRDEELNDLKNRFYEFYQEEKKYNLSELTGLLLILEKIEKENSLDNYLEDTKNKLQTIWDKLKPYQFQTSLLIAREGEATKDKLKGLSKYELEVCKNALEEAKELICLFPSEEHLLEEINNKLKTLDLEEEIQQLKNQNSSNQTSEQQIEIKQKIEQKEQELEELKKEEQQKLSDNQPQQPSKSNDNYENLTHEQLVKEINKLKAEIKELKNNKDISDSEKQSKLQEKQNKLEKLEKLEKDKRGNNFSQQSSLNNDTSFWNKIGVPLLVIFILLVFFASLVLLNLLRKKVVACLRITVAKNKSVENLRCSIATELGIMKNDLEISRLIEVNRSKQEEMTMRIFFNTHSKNNLEKLTDFLIDFFKQKLQKKRYEWT